jgi:hypothetical protein
LFDTTPAGRRPGYANFAVVDPPLKLVPFENPGATGTLNHLGVERESMTEVEQQAARLQAAGLALDVEAERARHGRRRVERTPQCKAAAPADGAIIPAGSTHQKNLVVHLRAPSQPASLGSRTVAYEIDGDEYEMQTTFALQIMGKCF